MYYILDVSRYRKKFVYIGVYLVLTLIERLFPTVCYFQAIFAG